LLLGFVLLAVIPLLVVGFGIRQYTRRLVDESFAQRAALTRKLVEGWRDRLVRQTDDAAARLASDSGLAGALLEPVDRARILTLLAAVRDEYGVDGIDLFESQGDGRMLRARTDLPAHSGFPTQVPADSATGATWSSPELGVVLLGSSLPLSERPGFGVAAYYRVDARLLNQAGEAGSFVIGATDLEGRPLLTGAFALDAWPDSIAYLVEIETHGEQFALGQVAPFYFALSLSERQSALGRLDLFLLLAIVLAVAVAVIAAWRVAVSAARPVEELAAAVSEWGRGGAMEPLSTFAEGEAATLVDAFEHLRRELVAAEKRVAEAARTAGWQEMARKVAHEIKNPLTPIRVTVEELARRAASNPAEAARMIPEAARLVSEEVTVLNRIVDAFSRFAKLPEPQLAPTDLSAVAGDVAGMYAQGPARVQLSTPGAVMVKADSLLLKEALSNIVKNAVEAAGPNGQVMVRVATEKGDGRIEVTDSGPGFPAAFFEGGPRPYFTTKSGGTGLGLVVAQRITTDMGGKVNWSNAPSGARVTLAFPCLN
jgi:signal transduction histidine kinase